MSNKITLLLLLVAVVALFYFLELDAYLTLDYLKASRDRLDELVTSYPLLSLLACFFIYVLVTALSIPGALIMTLAAGALFGLVWGVLLVSFASAVGATLAMLIARYLLRDGIEKRYTAQLKIVNQGIKKNGKLYLFSLRLIPLFPFFVVNLVMALTRIGVLEFFLVSQIGMLPATLVFVNAGHQLGQIESAGDVLSPALLGSFVLIGLLPWIIKMILNGFSRMKLYSQWEKPSHYDYDLIVIGAGSGGLVSALIASTVGARVALVEKGEMGGDCLNTGCVPSKALIRSARHAYERRNGAVLGLENIEPGVQFSSVMERVKRVIGSIAPHDSVERYEAMGVKVFQGKGTLVTPWSVEVNDEVLTAKRFIIASGASPAVLPIKGLEDIPYLTSENLWALEVLPKRLLVLGGGSIGLEMAQAFSRLGSQVRLVEALPNILAIEDPDISDYLMRKLKEEGVLIHKQTRLVSVRAAQGSEADRVAVILGIEGRQEVEFDALLVATGRKPEVAGFGLENLGIELNEKGGIAVNDYLQTSLPNIFAIGDVSSPIQLTNAASHTAWYATVNALFGRFWKFRVDYSVLPWCTFTSPEIARVGLNETQAKARGIDYEVTHYDLAELDRAVVEEEAFGVIKVLTRPGSDKILGVCICASTAGDMIAEYVLAMKHGLGLNAILSTPHVYPSWMEANKMLAGRWRRERAPARLISLAEKYFNLKRNLPWL